MCVRALKGLYGVVKISSPIPPPPPHLMHLPMTPEFPVKWLRTMRVSMKTIAQLKIGATGMFVGRTVNDSKFESKVGSEIMYISYRKPAWDWSAPDQFPLAEEYLIQQRQASGEVTPTIHPDLLFGPDWIERVANPNMFEKKAPSLTAAMGAAKGPALTPSTVQVSGTYGCTSM
jgi:hypothetical protein